MQRNVVLKAAQRCILYWEQHSTRCYSPQDWNVAVRLSCVEWSCTERNMSSNTVCHIPHNALHTNSVRVHERRGRIKFMLLLLSPNSWSRYTTKRQRNVIRSSDQAAKRPNWATRRRGLQIGHFLWLKPNLLNASHPWNESWKRSCITFLVEGLCLLSINLRTPTLLQRPNYLKLDVTTIVHVTHQTDEICLNFSIMMVLNFCITTTHRTGRIRKFLGLEQSDILTSILHHVFPLLWCLNSSAFHDSAMDVQ